MDKYFQFSKPKGYIPSTLSRLKDAVRELESLQGEMTFTRKDLCRSMEREEQTQLADLFQDVESAMQKALDAIESLDEKAVAFTKMQAAIEHRKAEADEWGL